jgi:hypothetical protein
MQAWEYKSIVEKDHQKTEAAMNKAGEEGWGAFAGAIWTLSIMKGGSHLIWLKRPKQT